MTAIAIQHKDEIITRMARGEPITSIAQSLGYADHSGIIHRLDGDPDYQAALKSGLIGKIEKRERELEAATDNVTVTRADRLLGHARWWAERLDPARFGQKGTNINIINGVSVDQALDSLAGSLLDKVRTIATIDHVAAHSTADAHEPECE